MVNFINILSIGAIQYFSLSEGKKAAEICPTDIEQQVQNNVDCSERFSVMHECINFNGQRFRCGRNHLWHQSMNRNSEAPDCGEGIFEGDKCPGEGNGDCVDVSLDEDSEPKLKCMKKINGDKVREITRPLSETSVESPERRNTFQWCGIPEVSVVYLEAEHVTEITQCYKADGKKLAKDKVGTHRTVCHLGCKDHRKDPHLWGKDNKPDVPGLKAHDNRAFQVICLCQQKNPGKCGWKTYKAGTKEFAGGNIMCKNTNFAAKPIFLPNGYTTSDLEILENWADHKQALNHKIKYPFNSDLFEVNYVHETLLDNPNKPGKKMKAYVPMDPNEHQYWDSKLNIFKFPTDLLIDGNKKAVNVRAVIKCKSHPADRQFFTLQPYCKNQRHKLRKGRPGECGWRIYEIQPNPIESYNDSALGFDVDYKVGKPRKYTGKEKNSGLKGKAGTSAISALTQGNKAWRCPDYLDNKLK